MLFKQYFLSLFIEHLGFIGCDPKILRLILNFFDSDVLKVTNSSLIENGFL